MYLQGPSRGDTHLLPRSTNEFCSMDLDADLCKSDGSVSCYPSRSKQRRREIRDNAPVICRNFPWSTLWVVCPAVGYGSSNEACRTDCEPVGDACEILSRHAAAAKNIVRILCSFWCNKNKNSIWKKSKILRRKRTFLDFDSMSKTGTEDLFLPGTEAGWRSWLPVTGGRWNGYSECQSLDFSDLFLESWNRSWKFCTFTEKKLKIGREIILGFISLVVKSVDRIPLQLSRCVSAQLRDPPPRGWKWPNHWLLSLHV